MTTNRARFTDLTDVDRRILRELETVHGEGIVLGGDLAAVCGVSGRGFGSRLHSLRKRGLVESAPVLDWLDRPTRRVGWRLTEDGMDGGPW